MLAAMPRRITGTESVLQQERGSATDRWRTLLLSGTALSLGAMVSLAAPPAALANCTASGFNPVLVVCDADTTTQNNNNPPNNVDARNQIYPGDIDAEVQAGVTVDGYGLRIETIPDEESEFATGQIEMDHLGDAVILDAGNEDADTLGGAFGPGALELNGKGGLVSYTGTGDIHNLTTTGAGLLVTNSGEIQVDHTLGTIVAPGIGIYAASTGATADVAVAAGGIVQGGSGSILARAAGTGDASVNLLDGAELEGGVLAQSILGNASITAGDNVTVIGNSPGAASITAGGNATQVWGDDAFVTGSSGLVVDQTSPAGAGVATVVVGNDGEIIGDGSDSEDPYNGNGIFAGNQGTGLTSVTTGTGTTVTGEANGIVAFQTNAQNASDMTITTDGPVTGSGTIPFELKPYTTAFIAAELPTTGLGIGVSNVGSGDIIVTAGDTVFGDNTGIQTLAAGGGNTGVTTGGDVTGGVHGIDATATGAGNIEIDVAGGATVTGTTGSGISTVTAAGVGRVENAGVVEGAVAAISGVTGTVLEIVNEAGGLIQNLSADLGDLAIAVTGAGVADIDNDGTIVGRVTTAAGNDTLTNSGLWATTGVSDFGAGTDAVVNTGRISVAEEAAVAEITHFTNLESFTNANTGVIDMVDDNSPGVRDVLTIDGTYTGEPGSTVEMDLALVGGYNPHTSSDLLVLDPANPAEGTTDFVFNIVSTGVSATTATGTRVAFAGGQLLTTPVTVVENRGGLITSSGDDNIPLARSGLVNYDFVNNGNDYQVVSGFDGGLSGGIMLPIPAVISNVAFATQRTPNPITATCTDPDNKPNAQGGWVRGFGGQFNTEASGTAPVGGSVSKLTSDNETGFATLQGGFDHVICNLDEAGSTLHLGVTVGHTWGASRQTDPDPLAGVFGTDVDFNTFFIGPYAAFTRGDLAVQAALRFDSHEIELSNPTVGIDVDGLDIDGSGISGSSSVSYDFDLDDLTLTPDIGVNVSSTEMDRFDIAGGTVIYDDLWSVMGHAGVTARTTLAVTDNVFVVPFAAATVYHEFIDHGDATLLLGDTTTEVESNRIGTFGQLGIGANAIRIGDVVAGRPTLFGGARVDLQVGERIEGGTATVFGRVQF